MFLFFKVTSLLIALINASPSCESQRILIEMGKMSKTHWHTTYRDKHNIGNG